MAAQRKYPEELREHAVKMVFEIREREGHGELARGTRQTLRRCAVRLLRMPYVPDPGAESDAKKRLAFEASREVRYTVTRVITAHLKDDASVSWHGLNFDFTGVGVAGGDFSGRSQQLMPLPCAVPELVYSRWPSVSRRWASRRC
jgi:hypothetical protein